MLQYLDAYVCELNKFLTGQTLLLGAYMAVKLTEPPTPGELIQVCHLAVTFKESLESIRGRRAN